MTGICKRYDISIPSIQTAEDLRSSLTDLNRNGSVLKTTFISSGKIYVLAKPEMASEELKAILSSKKCIIRFPARAIPTYPITMKPFLQFLIFTPFQFPGFDALAAPPPSNDDPCNATPLTVGATCNYVQYTNDQATATAGVPAPGCASYSGETSGSVWSFCERKYIDRYGRWRTDRWRVWHYIPVQLFRHCLY